MFGSAVFLLNGLNDCRKQLEDILDNLKEKPDVATLLLVSPSLSHQKKGTNGFMWVY